MKIDDISLDEEPFIVIDNRNAERIIIRLCNLIFDHHLFYEDLDEDGNAKETITNDSWQSEGNIDVTKGKNFLISFLNMLPKPITVVQETFHIDKSFRDTYYLYFSNQHFQIKRYSRRLSFFIGTYSSEMFYDFRENDSTGKKMQENFIGSCVINPLVTGAIGKTLIDPKYLFIENKGRAFMRLSEFTVHIFGRPFYVKAFPYRMQDEETMRCAEVTLLNILDYYSNTYDDYKSVVPSEIISKEQMFCHERVLPAKGISFPILTKVLSEFGFSPRLYNINAIESFKLSGVSREDELKRWLHYYIESGIPVAINLVPIEKTGAGHSIICIGHGEADNELKRKAYKKKWISWDKRESSHPIINSADFYDDYVIVDDNSPVYQLRKFNELSLHPGMKIENIAVPLYKRMFLDAPNAFAIIRPLINNEYFGIDNCENPDKGAPVIIRMFMASSCSFKNFRMRTLDGLFLKQLYTLIPMPRFIWVCELYREDEYDDLNAFGEIVIDATSSPNRGHRSLIMMHYPGMVAFRSPEQEKIGFEDVAKIENDKVFPGYKANLSEINW